MLQRSIQSVFEVTGRESENMASQTISLKTTFHESCDLSVSSLSELENHTFPPLKLLRLPRKTRSSHIRPYPRVSRAPTSTFSRSKCDPTWGRGKCDPRAWWWWWGGGWGWGWGGKSKYEKEDMTPKNRKSMQIPLHVPAEQPTMGKSRPFLSSSSIVWSRMAGIGLATGRASADAVGCFTAAWGGGSGLLFCCRKRFLSSVANGGVLLISVADNIWQ